MSSPLFAISKSQIHISRIRCGGGYIRCPKTFVITDALVVKPLSEISDVITTPDLRMDYEERKIVIGQKEVTWKELL